MQSYKNQIKAFFNFNKRQERGAFVLIILIVLAFSVNLLLPKLMIEKPYDFSSTLAEIEAWKASTHENISEESFKPKSGKLNREEVESVKLSPFPFNPNKFPQEKWLEMGLPKSVVATILKFETKGGSFKKAEDLQKIYGLSEEMFLQLKDFVFIPDTKSPEKIVKTIQSSLPEKSQPIVRHDINRTDADQLLQIPGIGPFYAGQIIKYRDQLGGYNSLDQLNELYKMDSVRLQSWLPYLSFKDTVLIQLDINSIDFKTILKHPYIDYETAKKILNHRKKLGRYAGLYQLKNDQIISDSLFLKLEPYLKVD